MKVVLALAPVWDSVTPPLAIAFLKGSLQQAGYDCTCLDFSIQFRPMMVSVLGDRAAEHYVEENPKLYKGWAKQIVDLKPDIVGFSLLGSNLAISAMVAHELRKVLPNVLIVAGGPSLTRENMSAISDTLEYADYVVEGEGESILVDLVRCYESKGDITKLKQLWILDKAGLPCYTGPGVQQDIDRIPYPDFTDFDRKIYRAANKLPILFSRGCILNCNYCENKWNHLTQRSRTGRNVFEELKHDVIKYNINEYMFNDDSLISSKTMRQMDEYCDLVIAEGLVMPWNVYGTRVERLITQPFLNKLRRSGMERVSLGVESFSSRVQKEMGKSSRYDDADKMCRMFAEEGIRTESWIIYGYPTETNEDFDETLQWFIKNPNILSHVIANAFGPNGKYMSDRPGVVTNLSPRLGDWVSAESTLAKRKERFLALIEVLETIRKARKGAFTFHFGDPLYVKYFSTWTQKDKDFLFDAWERLESPAEYAARPRGIRKVLNFLGVAKKVVPQKTKDLSTHETIRIGDLDTMKEHLFNRIESHLSKGEVSPEEVSAKVEHYKAFFDQVVLHLNDNVSEDFLFALALKGPVDVLVADIDTHAPEYIGQMAVEASAKYVVRQEA
jgi:hypothetical protein